MIIDDTRLGDADRATAETADVDPDGGVPTAMDGGRLRGVKRWWQTRSRAAAAQADDAAAAVEPPLVVAASAVESAPSGVRR